MSGGGTADVAVVGGGPAGAAAAIRLAAAGRRVVVLERAVQAGHKVCGEFVSGEALEALDRLGVPAARLGAAAIGRVRLTARGRAAETALPFPAAGLSRPRLDAALLAGAEAAGAEVRRGVAVRAVEPGGRVRLGDGSVLRAGAVLLATGKHDLAGSRRETPWRGRTEMIGLKMHYALEPLAARRLGDAIELHLFPGGCAGLQPVDGAANLCITLTRSAFAAAGGCLESLLARIAAANGCFAAAMAGARPLWPKPLAIARVPYGYLAPPGVADEGIWRVGDQVAVTASFTGDGLAMALEGGLAAAEAMLAGQGAGAHAAGFGRRATRQIRPAMRLQALVDRPALHGPAVAAARFGPRALAAIARWTRLPPAEARPAPARRAAG